MILYYKTPEMATGKSCGGEFSSSREMEEFMEAAPETMPDNTMFYYRDRLLGMCWVLRAGKLLKVWSPHIYRKYKFTLADVMKAVPSTPTNELLQE